MKVVDFVSRSKDSSIPTLFPEENLVVLSKEDQQVLQGMAEELLETANKTQLFRTRTEMEVSVLNEIKFPTPAIKYWQAMREQNVMFSELMMLSFEYRKNLIEMKMIKRDVESLGDALQKELLQVEWDKRNFIRAQQERVAKARVRELKNWSEIKEREASRMSQEDLEDVDNSQLLGYTRRWINQAIVMGSGGSPSERQNLFGQLRTGMLVCIEKGLVDAVLKGLDPSVQKQIKAEYKI
ncbi:MAG: hypothetical protein EHM49_00145 [Deltaproteobacteria bacterium]|nr:MAG: hypothetical protein EHM49_00145 [Deltaproteobacteria bacterium]